MVIILMMVMVNDVCDRDGLRTYSTPYLRYIYLVPGGQGALIVFWGPWRDLSATRIIIYKRRLGVSLPASMTF